MIKTTEDLGQNILSGFIVSLVALPLSLGLALASGVPPMAGVIATVIGALLFSILGSSRLIISGPGNGLVVLSLYGVGVLGAGDPASGYPLLLAAILVSGLILILMGSMRFGILAELFPAAAIRGMLAAIGLMILSRQLHILLGVNPAGSSVFDLFLEIPSSLQKISSSEGSSAPWIMGISSLALLFLLPLLKYKIFKWVPGPMWVLALGIAYTYLSPYFPNWPQLAESQLIQLPPDLLGSFTLPSFAAWQSGSFWSISLSLAFIAAVESLLSIKAIDKLDPQQRRSNANRDLQALGLATVGSSLLGGLNVVAVIARSSVNLNNGASNAWSNLFHGFFLALFLVLFASQLEHIPLAVLAAILVHTGYKLTSPSQFSAMFGLGRDEFLLFLFTYLVTLSSNLIIGILSGMLLTLAYEVFSSGNYSAFLRSIYRPNVLLFEEQKDKFHLSVKRSSNFLNFIRLKWQLDTVDPHTELIVDFSLATYVDHTVLEHIQQYQHRFESAGGSLEVIGLDDLGQLSAHPLATRRPRRKNEPKHGKLTRRQKLLRLYCLQNGFKFHYGEVNDDLRFQDFEYFQHKYIYLLRNLIESPQQDWLWTDIHFEDPDYFSGTDRHVSMLYIPLKEKTAAFTLSRERLFNRVAQLAGFSDINFEKYPDFSARFHLKGKDVAGIRDFFRPELIHFLEAQKQYHIECNGRALLIFDKERLLTISETKQMVNFAQHFTKVLEL